MIEYLEPFGPVPSNYAGYWPSEHYCLYEWVESRGCVLDESNWHVICQRLGLDPDNVPGDTSAPVHEFIQRSWVAGRIRTLVVRNDAPKDILREADAIAKELQDYPILDEQDYSERVEQAAQDYWDNLSDSEKEDYLAAVDDDERDDSEKLGKDYIPRVVYDLVEEC